MPIKEIHVKCYHQLECNYLNNIQTESLVWLRKHYDLSNQTDLQTDLWLKIDYKDFLKNNPSLLKWFKQIKLLPREVAVTIVNSHKGAELHIDELPSVCKINIPILNYYNVVNEWYDVPKNLYDLYKDTNQFDSVFYDFSNLDISKCTLIDSVIPEQPIVFNSQIAHRVVVQPQAVFPRVMLTCMFHNEPREYLND